VPAQSKVACGNRNAKQTAKALEKNRYSGKGSQGCSVNKGFGGVQAHKDGANHCKNMRTIRKRQIKYSAWHPLLLQHTCLSA
jgi:hypothetical protein